MDDASGPTRREEDERSHAEHLERSERKWDRWSNWYRMSEADFEPIRETAIDAASIEAGDRVIDIGCGPGVNFEQIRERIDSSGQLVGLDYSPEMVEKAGARVREHGWEHVTVVRADATTADLGGPYDVATATLSLSVMPDVEEAVTNIHASLVPGGTLAVVGIRPFPRGPARALNPVVRRLLRWYANWNGAPVIDHVEEIFDETELLGTWMGGTTYALVARRAP